MPRETIECVSACRATTCSVIYISGAIEMRIKVVHSKIKILARFESAIILVKIEKKIHSFYLGHRGHLYCWSPIRTGYIIVYAY